jgi:hypothetical protein
VKESTAVFPHVFEVPSSPEVQPSQKKRGRPRSTQGAKTAAQRKASSRARKRSKEEAASDYEFERIEALFIGVTLPASQTKPKLEPPTSPEPEFPTYTGDRKTDAELERDYKYKLAAFQAEWDAFLNADPESHEDRGMSIPGHGQLVTGDWDSERIDRVDAAGADLTILSSGILTQASRIRKAMPPPAIQAGRNCTNGFFS